RQRRSVLQGQAADRAFLLRPPVSGDRQPDAHRPLGRGEPAGHRGGAGMNAFNARLAAALLMLAGGAAWAQMTPVGTWHSIDDSTGEPKARVVIAETGGVLNGHIEKVLRKDADPNAVCDK